jgi:hypothetical protein
MEVTPYLRRSKEIMLVLTPIEVRKFEYECAVKFNIKVPDVWIKINEPFHTGCPDFMK